jgi:hypothetical protein
MICKLFSFLIVRFPCIKVFIFKHQSLFWLQRLIIDHDISRNYPEGFVPNGIIIRAPSMFKINRSFNSTESSGEDTISTISESGSVHSSNSENSNYSF